MATEILQVRDVPAADAEILRNRAAAASISLSRYVRELIHDDTSRPTMDEVLARIATREQVEVDSDDVRSLIELEHR